MSLFKRDWTGIEAEEWTHHDVWASALSAASFFLTAIGVAGSLLMQTWGFVALGLAIVCVWVMFRIIDPKLRAISTDFEAKEAAYIEQLDRATRWEAGDER